MTWTALNDGQLERLMSRIATPHRPEGFQVFVRDPGWYREGAILELQTARSKASFIAAGPGELAERTFYPLNGDAARLHAGNRAARIDIGDAATAGAYLRFFCTFLDGDIGSAFNIVDRLAPGWTLENGKRPRLHPPLVAAAAEPGLFEAAAFVEYGAMLFRAEFTIRHDGVVEMTDDEPIGPLVRQQTSARQSSRAFVAAGHAGQDPDRTPWLH